MGSYGLNDIFHVQTKKTKHRPRTADVDDTELEQIEDRRFFRRFFFFSEVFFLTRKLTGFRFFGTNSKQNKRYHPKTWSHAKMLGLGSGFKIWRFLVH